MFPEQQGATCPAQLWPPRLGIKLLEGAPSTEKWRKGVYFRMPSQKIGAISLVFAHWVERAQSGHINPATPVIMRVALFEKVVFSEDSERHHQHRRGELELLPEPQRGVGVRRLGRPRLRQLPLRLRRRLPVLCDLGRVGLDPARRRAPHGEVRASKRGARRNSCCRQHGLLDNQRTKLLPTYRPFCHAPGEPPAATTCAPGTRQDLAGPGRRCPARSAIASCIFG